MSMDALRDEIVLLNRKYLNQMDEIERRVQRANDCVNDISIIVSKLVCRVENLIEARENHPAALTDTAGLSE